MHCRTESEGEVIAVLHFLTLSPCLILGGNPYTSLSISLEVERSRCTLPLSATKSDKLSPAAPAGRSIGLAVISIPGRSRTLKILAAPLALGTWGVRLGLADGTQDGECAAPEERQTGIEYPAVIMSYNTATGQHPLEDGALIQVPQGTIETSWCLPGSWLDAWKALVLCRELSLLDATSVGKHRRMHTP